MVEGKVADGIIAVNCTSNLFPFLGMCIYRSRFIEEATQSPAETN